MRARLVIAPCVLALLGTGPCGPVPGGRLDGPVAQAPVADWAWSNAFERCQLEVSLQGEPHSLLASCYADGPELWVGSVASGYKRWVEAVAREPRVRVRIAGRVFELRARRVEEPAERLRAGRARARKYEGRDPGPELTLPDDYAVFALESQSRGAR